MVINHNMGSVNANRMMGINRSSASKSMEKLSSGLRINRAGDDAAGLAISEKMRGQIRGLDQASANSQDGISMIQTAEGALGETHSILQRMRELAVQASNDTNVNVDRSEIQKEMDELTKEVTRISNNTEFNTQKLINGGITEDGIGSATFQIGANSGQGITLSIKAMDAKSLGITRDVSTSKVDVNNNDAKIASVSSDAVNVTKSLDDGKYQVEVKAVDAGATTALDARGNVVEDLVSGTATADTNITLTYTDHGTAATNKAAGVLANGAAMDTASSLTVNGKVVDLKAVKALGAGYDAEDKQADVATALQADLNAALGKDAYSVTVDAGHNITITSGKTGSGVKVDLTGSNTTSATLLGFTGSSITGTDGAATGGVKDWVATGSLGGVVSPTNNTVNGVTVDISKAPTTAVAGDTLTVKGYKDATMSAQLLTGTGAGAGTPIISQSNGAGATITAPLTTGTATANTNITLTYQEEVTAANAVVPQFSVGATVDFAIGSPGANANGIIVKFDTADSGEADPTAAWDSNSNTITIKLSATTGNNDTAKLTAAIKDLGTNNVITKFDGTTVNLASASITAGAALDIADVTASSTGTFGSGKTAVAAGWTASGDLTGAFAGDKVVNGVTLDFSQITSTSAKTGETIKINAVVTKEIGNAVTIDQKNGGSYVLGDANGLGQAKVAFTGGQTEVGQSTVDITTQVATSASKLDSKTMSQATAIGGLDISTQSKASSAITTIQSALENVSSERSKLGAYQNRLEHTIANLGTSSENLTSAESRIRDVDMAKEMSTFSKNNILAQAAQSMLAQANQQPQQVLSLLQ